MYIYRSIPVFCLAILGCDKFIMYISQVIACFYLTFYFYYLNFSVFYKKENKICFYCIPCVLHVSKRQMSKNKNSRCMDKFRVVESYINLNYI